MDFNDREWDLVDDAVGRLEAAWRMKAPVDFQALLPPSGDPHRNPVLRELIKADQELRWRSGERKLLESYLTEWPELLAEESDVVELLRAECETRALCDILPTREELAARFPKLGAEIDLNCIAATVRGERGELPDISSISSLNIPCDAQLTAAFSKSSTDPQVPARPSPPLESGDILGNYEIMKVLGQGAMGTVYLARQKELDWQVAIKIPRLDQPHSARIVERLLEEAKTVVRLKHPHIVTVHHIDRDAAGTPYVVMDYIEGGTLGEGCTLGELLQRERLAPERAAELLIPTAEAVHFAHRHGFVHRDLKPGNILLDREGRPHVADFGLALHESRQQRQAGEYAGTFRYMAPEQVRGETHRLDGRADVWALGVILYEMLAGRRPFESADPQILEDEILHRDPRPPRQIDDKIPAELEKICLKCLKKDAAQRYLTAADLAEDLRQWRQPGRALRRKLLGTGLVAGLILFLGWAFWRESPPPGRTQGTAPTVAPLEGTLDVLIWNTADPARRGLSLLKRQVMSLRPNDKVQIKADLNRPAYIYLVWIDSRGAAWPVYPWTRGRWDERPQKEIEQTRLSLPPAADEGWAMQGPPGMETLLLLARAEPLPRDLDLKGFFTELPKAKPQNLQAPLWFVRGKRIPEDADSTRGPNFSNTSRIDDAVLRTQRIIQERLEPHFIFTRAVSVASEGEENEP
ncbi:MAG: protein kinase [Pirellulales bacterium]|nr:protein kinase [Pirellulales bacterium]